MKYLPLALVLLLSSNASASSPNAKEASPNALRDDALAQETPPPAATAAPAVRLYQADEANLSRLAGALGQKPGAVSLRASLAALEANEAARDALLSYVRGGGLVFLHTDAAQLFGYTTVAAREATNQRAGQLFGRARRALMPGASPLLMADAASNAQKANNVADLDPNRLPGVDVVFYEMQAGDVFATRHAAATPLLEATDLASNSQTPLYAAAIAPFGDGWAVLTPDFVDNKRADGALFLRNLLKLAPDAKGVKAWSAINASSLESATDAPADLTNLKTDLGKASGAAPALPAFGTGAAPPAQPKAPVANPVAPSAQLLVSSDEARALTAMTSGADSLMRTAMLQVLRARLELQRGELETATFWLDRAAQNAPNMAEVAALRGLMALGAALELNQPAPLRRDEMVEAATQFDAALAVAPALLPVDNSDNKTAKLAEPMVLGMTTATLREYSTRAKRAATIFNLEPPFVRQFGTGDAAITVRYFDNDAAIRLVFPGAQALAGAQNLGWRANREEVLLFPSPQLFQAHRSAVGLRAPTAPAPAGAIGDVVGARLSMVSLLSNPVVRPGVNGRPPQVLATGNQSLLVLGRLHSYVLIAALAEGGTRPPEWMQIGLEGLLNLAIQGGGAVSNDGLTQMAATGTLLGPNQFRNARGGGQNVAELQAASLMNYFYGEFGAGAVAETFQRLGAGRSADDALNATTGLDQNQFFVAWRDQSFGVAR